ncbi:MAG: SigB/SigF/SigG family RNA polymerase sigma factor [Armatimonadota bacterium]
MALATASRLGRGTDSDRRSTEELIAELRRTGDPHLRDQVIERHDGLVRAIASKFARPGASAEDLAQAGWIALIRALDRFDPERQTKFSTYATHCVVGEIKRYFRDRTWGMRVPRSLQEVAANLNRMHDDLIVTLGREPTMAEMAEGFGITEEFLAEAMEVGRNYLMRGLHERYGEDGDEGMAVADRVGHEDHDMEAVIEFAPLQEALEQLEPRDRYIIERRFYGGCSQQQVAEELELSQMHISRLERRALRRMRDALADQGQLVPA